MNSFNVEKHPWKTSHATCIALKTLGWGYSALNTCHGQTALSSYKHSVSASTNCILDKHTGISLFSPTSNNRDLSLSAFIQQLHQMEPELPRTNSSICFIASEQPFLKGNLETWWLLPLTIGSFAVFHDSLNWFNFNVHIKWCIFF